ncbi:hypothetical protein FOWG_05185 [Fusarium oxysporum f. sp. lycopersici MN25]|nr:hypothetical protein FOWG_05185 [Fusarium oxysporum f. sp. lycopersici MN25]
MWGDILQLALNNFLMNHSCVFRVGESDGVKPTLIGHIPAGVTHVINGKSVALSPVPVNFTNIVETGGVIVSWLEVLRLVHLVRMRKLNLTELLLASGTTNTSDIRDMLTTRDITCKDGDRAGHSSSTSNTDRGDACDLLDLRHELLRLVASNEDWLLAHVRLLVVVGLLLDNVAALNGRLGSHTTDGGLL